MTTTMAMVMTQTLLHYLVLGPFKLKTLAMNAAGGSKGSAYHQLSRGKARSSNLFLPKRPLQNEEYAW